MKIISSSIKLKKVLREQKSIGFVPTMGAIHKGHISLIKKSISECNKTVVSIFVNKPQFNKFKDFNDYPRPLSKDIALMRKNKIDYLFIPTNSEIHNKKSKKKIIINSFYKKLCGRFRPGHFISVVDVVYKFVKIIQPKNIYLGEKDYQQYKLIKDYFKTNKIRTKVIMCKTIREKNGIALSSRNSLLTKDKKVIAGKVYRLIVKNKKNLINKIISINYIKGKILRLGVNKIDYLNIININRIIKPFKKNKKYKIFFSYYLDDVRLIDNI